MKWHQLLQWCSMPWSVSSTPFVFCRSPRRIGVNLKESASLRPNALWNLSSFEELRVMWVAPSWIYIVSHIFRWHPMKMDHTSCGGKCSCFFFLSAVIEETVQGILSLGLDNFRALGTSICRKPRIPRSWVGCTQQDNWLIFSTHLISRSSSNYLKRKKRLSSVPWVKSSRFSTRPSWKNSKLPNAARVSYLHWGCSIPLFFFWPIIRRIVHLDILKWNKYLTF